MADPKTKSEWDDWGRNRLMEILDQVEREKNLRRFLPTGRELSVDVEFVGKKKAAEFNGKHRDKDYATDVLSFPNPEPFYSQGELGSILICTPVMKENAKKNGNSSVQEGLLLLVHGVLHLIGMDHEKGEAEAVEMSKWEKKILKEVSRTPTKGLIAREA